MISFWDGLTSGLGTTLGIYRGGGTVAIGVTRADTQRARQADLAANRRLREVRLEEYQALEPELIKNCAAEVKPAPEAAFPESSSSLSL
jgi:hypothetical protein